MKTKLTFSFLCLICLFSCRNETERQSEATTSIYAHSAYTYNSSDYTLTYDHWSERGYVPVYQFGHLTVMTYEVSQPADSFNKLNAIFEDIYEKDSFNTVIDDWSENGRIYRNHAGLQLVDTMSDYTIWSSSHLSAKLLPFMEKEYFIYGTKGYMKCKVRDAVFYSGACTAFYGLSLDGYDERKCGHALFSHAWEIPIQYDGDYKKIQADLNEENKTNLRDSANYYKNYIPATAIAHYGSHTAIVYCDDFTWTQKDNNSKTLFPSREIRSNHAVIWSSRFDAFGTPCD